MHGTFGHPWSGKPLKGAMSFIVIDQHAAISNMIKDGQMRKASMPSCLMFKWSLQNAWPKTNFLDHYSVTQWRQSSEQSRPNSSCFNALTTFRQHKMPSLPKAEIADEFNGT